MHSVLRDLVFPAVIDTFPHRLAGIAESRMPEQSPQREQMNTIVWVTRSTSLRGQLEHGSATVAQKAASSSAAKPQRAVEIAGRSQDRAERVESIRATVL